MAKDSSDAFAVFLGGLLVGMAGGIVAGILTAPKSGEEFRDDLWTAATTVQGKMEDELQHADDRTREFWGRKKLEWEDRWHQYNDSKKAGKMARAKQAESEDWDYDIGNVGYVDVREPSRS